MTPRERAAYNAGLRAAIHAARTAAITMETAPGSTDVRKQAAVAALYAFAESAEALALTSSPDASSRCIPAEFAAGETISDLGVNTTATV
ncbi:hypothetical protein MKK55_28860 [Methylobacterium sp. J-059]|uniref:hypothetical protein n=1 Tax=Methylobacterium sp. J-059 TaxID=2836643 RepID=UPI001FB9BD9C|nr:hypothetical protein [Methylobacterium sp. J-059]MCJ2042928.1 hypothetical protein [Methylobacterium sp. J-059]